MISINTQTVCAIISKARQFHAKEEVSFPEDDADLAFENDPMQILADHKGDLTLLEVKDIVSNLEPDQQNCLLAMMYVGRGDYTAEEWDEALELASQNRAPHLAEYLLAKPFIANYLEDALVQLGYEPCEE
ncbi:MAG: hypothetical protein K0S29_1063 [Gammaproteobacteria bacterium]|jgi:hypothetical protein|nr:hypothetical protein [Gammaproteobacteria bacterium]